MTRTILALLVALAGAGPLAAQLRQAALRPQSLTTPEQEALLRYLGCIECWRTEFDSIRALAARKPLATVDSLRRVLVVGLDSGRIQAHRAFLEDLYSRSARWSLPRDAFLEHYTAAFGLAYRRRAAVVLRWLSLPRADSVLTLALLLPLPPEVHDAVDYALHRLRPPP